MEKLKVLVQKTLYGFLFAAVIPALLILWAVNTDNIITIPVPHFKYIGYLLLATGVIFMITGMLHLLVIGKGLPMNPFPPEKLVKKGIYAFTKHPIYAGAIMASFGTSLAFNSSSGFWFVSPLFTLMIAAYIIGFENERTKALFGPQDYSTFLSLPTADDKMPSFGERLSATIVAYIPWFIVYEAFIIAGVPNDAISSNLPFEKNIPVMEFSEYFYFLAYFFVMLVPFVIRKRSSLRKFITDVWFIIIVTGLIYLLIPFIVSHRDFVPHSFAGRYIIAERLLDAETCALPSSHVIWVFVAAMYFTEAFRRTKVLWYLLAILISLSCILTGNHSIPDVIAGFCIFIAMVYRQKIWDLIRLMAENLANSWREWRIGPIRIINHGFFGGAAGFAGAMIAGFFLGPHDAVAGFIVLVFVIIGSALWAQVIEGSSKLLRPYGYYGGLIGGIAASAIIALIFHINLILLLGAFAMAGPWIQALGRLRCLVQGCCHGKPSDEKLGIRFIHPLSRVNKISGLKGLPLHPTQLYSIATNIVSGLFLIRLYSLGMPAIFILGMYLMLNGLGRFVEESFRGEAQTPYWAGMRLYQWIAIVNIITGAICTAIPDTLQLTFKFNTTSVFLGVAMGILVTIASGVDFPTSNKRFARLTSN
jgi:protein-S-isoprenylcysteine O-methyltransferase Ste14